MSYDQKFKGKLVWGTSVFRIHLVTEMKKLKQDFSGSLTLFERRHEKSKHKFQDLEQFISTLRELWKESLRSDTVQDTRLSRWIEEYFTELNISANYQEILDAIRGEFEEVPPLEVGETEQLDQEHVNEFLPSTDEYMGSGTNQKIKGDLDNKEEVDEILGNFLDEHKPARKKQAISRATFSTADGQEKTIEDKKEIVDQPLADEVKLSSGFNNDYGMVISDISFSDVVPFDYEINDISVSGVDAKKIAEEVTPDGLEVKWSIDTLQAGEKTDIEYQLGKRMLRTILIRDDYDLTILQTYENIERDEKSAWVESTYVFQDQTPIVENVKILDQIPGEYQLVDSTPEAVPPLATIRASNATTEITWSYTDVPASTQFVLTYELDTSSKVLRDRAQVYGKSDELLLQAVRIVRPNKNGEGYDVVFALKAEEQIDKPVLIKEDLPSSYTIEHIDDGGGSFVELQQADFNTIVWKLDTVPRGTTLQAIVHYKGSESYVFDNFRIEIENEVLQKEQFTDTLKKDEKILLPPKLNEQ